MKHATKTSILKPEIYYILPNNKRIELLSEMHTANFDFGDFDEPIKELLKAYYETTEQSKKNVIELKIGDQCSAFADFLGTQYGEIQSMINFSDLSIAIKQALFA